MTDPNNPHQPLLGAAVQQTAVDVGAPAQGPRSSRAYKVAGFTFLACVLIVSQAAIAYFLLSQGSDIKSLEEQNHKFNVEMTQGRSVSMPGRKHMAMNALAPMMDVSMDEEASTAGQGKTAGPLTICQMEAKGLKPMKVPGFRPTCDKRGLYKAQQCYMGHCWCVDPTTGQMISEGAKCAAPIFSGGLIAMTDVETDADAKVTEAD
ncbi:uncharacterized protein LOC133463444 [Cololabis saira]|uniref:uncharacterized protein LOC133463444 n=1 Tax=Cololabis saira TaxID=129043 RepID=UPI002AD3FD03|nr:uncharacterized protein LOC133463444 [Cololabis saira]